MLLERLPPFSSLPRTLRSPNQVSLSKMITSGTTTHLGCLYWIYHTLVILRTEILLEGIGRMYRSKELSELVQLARLVAEVLIT